MLCQCKGFRSNLTNKITYGCPPGLCKCKGFRPYVSNPFTNCSPPVFSQGKRLTADFTDKVSDCCPTLLCKGERFCTDFSYPFFQSSPTFLDQFHACFKDKTRFLESVFNRGKNVLLNPLTNRLERCSDTIQQTFRNVPADLCHNSRRRVNTEQVFEPLDKRLYHIFINPRTDTHKEVFDTLTDTRNDIAANFLDSVPVRVKECFAEWNNNVIHNELSNIDKPFSDCFQKIACRFLPVCTLNIFVPPLLNVLCNTSKEAAQELHCGTDCCTQERKETLCDTSVVNVCYKILYLLPENLTDFRPVITVQPVRTFIKNTFDKVR